MTAQPSVTADDLADMIERGDVSGVTDALRADPSLASARTGDGDTPLHIACWQKQLAILATLLLYHPDVNARGDSGRTPMHYAVYEPGPLSAAVVGTLMAEGADPALRDDLGLTVEDAAKAGMDDGLAEVLDMLHRPWPAPKSS